ncbi:MAG: TrmH family RNA methyltransferase [Marinilabiliales bacterium]|nr:MAG: TrmH family RNA methyltransferase [Marinilabiliales bacterium]
MSKELIEHLSDFVSAHRLEAFERVLEYRTRYLTVVCENIYQGHNASAVLRTCDCFGIQDVHIIESGNSFEINPEVALGASKWLSIRRYEEPEGNIDAVFNSLRNKGYRIVAASPHQSGVSLEDFDIGKGPSALVLGTEKDGLSQAAMACSDEFITIDMYGFTGSFNVSVSAGIILYNLRSRLNNSDISWHLDGSSVEEIKLEWLRQSIKRADLIERDFLTKHKHAGR